jgi:hypothetical protein
VDIRVAPYTPVTALLMCLLLGACVGGNGTTAATVPPTPTANSVNLSVDTGPAGATGQVNHPYVTVKVCAAGSTTSCASIDHVLLDTGSVGLRLVRSVLTAQSLTLSASTDTSGQTVEECVAFGGGQTWGPVALADVTLASEIAHKVPVQVMDDTSSGAPPPASCGANGTLINTVSAWGANGVLGLGVFTEDCGSACVSGTPLPFYYGCTAAGACTAENMALASQVANVVAMFAADNNGILVKLPNLVNANGDAAVQGQLIFGLSTQADNTLPATGLTVLQANSSGDFTANYNGSSTALPSRIDSGTDSYAFNDPTIPVCSATTAGIFAGYYCPASPPQNLMVVNTSAGTNNVSSTINFAITDPSSFVVGAAAFIDLGGGGGSTRFTWGMPFFYGRNIYIGFDQRVAATYTGPFYAY